MNKRTIIVVGGGILFAVIVSTIFFAGQGKKTGKVTTSALLKEADSVFQKGDLKKAKELYKKVKENTVDAGKLKDIQKKIEEINLALLFSSLPDECSTIYTVKPRDTLTEIAQKFTTTVNLIKRANNLTSDIIRPQEKLKVNVCKFSIVIDKSQNLLFLKRNGEVIKTYIVATGKNNSTPTGNFKIVTKLIKPTWFKTGAIIPPDSPENILGSRWMGFNIKGYGIHGTTAPDNLGRQVTLGCIRMRNKDVEGLFDIVPAGTEVTIVD